MPQFIAFSPFHISSLYSIIAFNNKQPIRIPNKLFKFLSGFTTNKFKCMGSLLFKMHCIPYERQLLIIKCFFIKKF